MFPFRNQCKNVPTRQLDTPDNAFDVTYLHLDGCKTFAWRLCVDVALTEEAIASDSVAITANKGPHGSLFELHKRASIHVSKFIPGTSRETSRTSSCSSSWYRSAG